VECPECGDDFERKTFESDTARVDEPLRLEWEQLYDGRLRAVLSGTVILLPPEAPAFVRHLRSPLHECEPNWPDDIRDYLPPEEPDWPDQGGGSHVPARPVDRPPSGAMGVALEPDELD
jgi:hypothetical protein